MVNVIIDNIDIIDTKEHQFWVQDKGWTIAGELKSGDILVNQDGTTTTVDVIWFEKLQSLVTVYNFEVEDWHNYYVGPTRILVHNECWIKGTGEVAEWTNHGFKHFAPKNMSWKNVVKSTKSGPAKYLKGAEIEALERMVWKNGTDVTNGKTWKVMEFDEVIGASLGKETKYMRVEFSSGTIHGHPITKSEYNKLLK